MKYWTRVNIIFGCLELLQSLFLGMWVFLDYRYIAALAAATFLSMLVTHLLTGMSLLASWVIDELRPKLVSTSST